MGQSYDYCNNRWICNGLGWEEKEMSLSQNLYLILVAVAIILPVWWIISAYNKRVNQIEELREEVEKLKRKDQRRE